MRRRPCDRCALTDFKVVKALKVPNDPNDFIMKRLLLCAALVFFAFACGKDETGSRSQGGGEGDLTNYTVQKAAPDEWDGVKRSATTYQLLVYSFADSDGDGMGDFRGIMQKLDYIESLGATALWLSPIHPADSYHGYDVIDYTAVNPAYGTMADFEALVAAAHERGIKIYLDYVLNHTGKSHPWFLNAVKSTDNEYRDYYIFSLDPQADVKAGRIPMLTDRAYNSGEWFDVPTSEEGVASRRLKFSLAWGSRPTVTVTESDTVDAPNPDTSTADAKYLYFGDGECLKFYDKGGSKYELNVDFRSSWGFLVRTSTSTWEGGTKFGAPASAGKLALGVPFVLTSDGADNVVPDWIEVWKFHSNFYTEYMPDVNYGAIASFRESPTYKAMVESAKGWIDRGVDGFRLDAVRHIYHDSASSENPTFLNGFYTDLNAYFKQSHPDRELYMVGEVFAEADEVAPYYAGLPALFEFSFWNRLSWAVNNATGCYFVKDILSYQQLYARYRADYIEPTKLSNHDEERTRTVLGTTLDKAKSAAAVLLTAAGEPYVYYGEELGYVGSKSRGDEYVRNPMKWGDSFTTKFMDKQDSGMMSVYDVTRQSGDDASILNVYRQFGRLRHTYPSMASGAMLRHDVYNETNTDFKQIAAWYREADGERMLVLHNLSGTQTVLTLDDDIDRCVAVMNKVDRRVRDGVTNVRMSGYSSVVFKLK